ncbi:flagella associated protein, partial [Cystoisospora suis]
MRQRDEDIQESASRYSLAQDEYRQKLEKLNQMKRYTQEQLQANQELSKELQQLSAKVERLRKDFLDAKQKLSDVQEEGEDIRSHLSAVATATARTKAELGHLSEELEERKQTLSSLIYRRDQTKKKIEFELKNATKKDDLLKESESFCRQIEQQCEALEKTLKKAREDYFEVSRKKSVETLQTQAILGEIGSSQAALKNLTIQLQRLDQSRQRQQELLYTVEFQSQLMQRKVARVSGYCNTAEKKEFDQKIEKLE